MSLYDELKVVIADKLFEQETEKAIGPEFAWIVKSLGITGRSAVITNPGFNARVNALLAEVALTLDQNGIPVTGDGRNGKS